MAKTKNTQEKSPGHVAKSLSYILADTYILYVKTQNFHWNIVDPRFHALHVFFEEQYGELSKAIDEIAERIRMIGHKTPGTMKEFLELGSLEESNRALSGDGMIKELWQDHVTLSKHLRPQIDRFTELTDHGSADLLIGRLRSHEKAAWMLSSHLV